MQSSGFQAGASATDITPRRQAFLYGYPHIERYSEGTHDPLMTAALFLSNDDTRFLIIANDLINLDKRLSAAIRARVESATGIARKHIMVTATHTHSGPLVMRSILNEGDPVIPRPDSEYLDFMVATVADNARRAVAGAQPAEIAHATAVATGMGGNRRDPAGPADPAVPLLGVRNLAGEWLGLMLVCCMHPTVLHEDSLLFSADFPGMARRVLQQRVLGANCPVLHLTGPSGNQSPRHAIKGNTFAEAERLGEILAHAVAAAIGSIKEPDYCRNPQLLTAHTAVELPLREFLSPEAAREKLHKAETRLRQLRETAAPQATVRTAEVDVFGARRELSYAEAYQNGGVEQAHRLQMPAEIQAFRIGERNFTTWPGEFFVEFGLELKMRCADTFPITLANGVLNGYVVTPEAFEEGGYEASSGLLSHRAGALMVQASADLLRQFG